MVTVILLITKVGILYTYGGEFGGFDIDIGAAAIMIVIITVIFYVITANTAIRAVIIAVVITFITITAPIFFLLWLRSFLISFNLLPII